MYFIHMLQNKVEEYNTFSVLVTSHLSLLVLPAPIYFLNCFLDLSQLRLNRIMLYNFTLDIWTHLYPIEHVLQNLIVLLPALSSIIEHQVEVHDSGSLVF